MTQAHELSQASVIDPAYSAEKLLPEPFPKAEFPFLYGPEDFLSARLEEMRAAIAKAKMHVYYPGQHRDPARQLFFISEYAGGPGQFRCPGAALLYLNGMEISVNYNPNSGLFSFEAPKGCLTVVICCETATFQPLWHAEWMCTADPASAAVPAEKHYGSECGEVPPHLEELPAIDLTPERKESGLYDAGREILAYVTVYAHDIDFFRVGESQEEALSENPENLEQTMELTEIMPGVWRTVIPLAFRYLQIKACELKKIVCHAVFTPECYRGAFASGDRELDDIWMRSAYTLRLCHRHFLIDGIKRDRLPWSGDLRISLLSSCFTFTDHQVVENTLQQLGCSGVLGIVNGITDFSPWFIINHDTWQLYTGRLDFLVQEYSKIIAVLENLAREEEPDTGFLPQGGWTLIDWFDFDKTSSLQILYCWALKAGSRLAYRMKDEAHEMQWNAKAEKLAVRIKALFQDSVTGIYKDGLQNDSIHRHANFLAILSGIETDFDKIAQILSGDELPAVGTPYMAALEIKALLDTGCRKSALEKIRRLWGAMLNDGASSFYEAFDPNLPADKRYSFYRRDFGLSLCHAWGSGPAWLLPEIFFGIRPLEDGWKKFTVASANLIQSNVYLTVPVPCGEIKLSLEKGKLSVEAPPECKMSDMDR